MDEPSFSPVLKLQSYPILYYNNINTKKETMATTSAARRRRPFVLWPTTTAVTCLLLLLLSSGRTHAFSNPVVSSNRRPTGPLYILHAVQVDPRNINSPTTPQPPSSRLEELLERSRLPTRSRFNNALQQQLQRRRSYQNNNSTCADKEELRASADDKDAEEKEGADDDATSSRNEGETTHPKESKAQDMQDRRKLAARAALLGSRVGNRSVSKKVPLSTTRTASSKASTSVGKRRVGSASKARQGPGATQRFMDAVRKSAVSKPVVTDDAPPKQQPPIETEGPSSALNSALKSPLPLSTAATAAALSTTKQPTKLNLSASRIQTAMLELMERQMKDHLGSVGVASTTGWKPPPASLQRRPSTSSSTTQSIESLFPRTPAPGTVLLPATTRSRMAKANSKYNDHLIFPDCLTVRTTTPRSDTEVAQLRLSVFSDFSPEVRRQLVSRSVKAVVSRRMQGATCLIATAPAVVNPPDTVTAARKVNEKHGHSPYYNHSHYNRPQPMILGSAECSFHEFQGTTLGYQRPEQSILYVTEVAVSPSARRKGVGGKLLQSIEKLANLRKVETLYLHVDVDNKGAIALYEKAGYQAVDNSEPMFLEFTTKLNLHDGATKGRNHLLLYKDLVKRPTWLPPPPPSESLELLPTMHGPAERCQPDRGALGFEVHSSSAVEV